MKFYFISTRMVTINKQTNKQAMTSVGEDTEKLNESSLVKM